VRPGPDKDRVTTGDRSESLEDAVDLALAIEGRGEDDRGFDGEAERDIRHGAEG
jgi:hypothetical protein